MKHPQPLVLAAALSVAVISWWWQPAAALAQTADGPTNQSASQPADQNDGQLLFSDDFDDGDVSDWQVVRNRQWSHPDRVCQAGDQPAKWQLLNDAFGIEINGPGCVTEITPDGLDLSQAPAYRLEFVWQLSDSIEMDRNIAFAWQDSDNWYGYKLFGQRILLQKVVDGKALPVANDQTRFPFVADRNYQVAIEVKPGLTRLFIDGNQVLESADTAPFIEGPRTIALQASSGAVQHSSSFFDDITVRRLAVTQNVELGVEHLIQTRGEWAEAEYDTALSWYQSVGGQSGTFFHWACNLMSQTMILRYHGLDQLPGGQPLTPLSLNQWYIDNGGYYRRTGLIIPSIIADLTAATHAERGTPKFEQQKVTANIFQTAATEILAGRPVIMEVGGFNGGSHFLVADGVTADGNDLILKDPGYPWRDRFSKVTTGLKSVRVFQPSLTDLSYVEVLVSGGVVIESAGEQVGQGTSTLHSIEAIDSATLSPLVTVFELPRPDKNQLDVQLTAPQSQLHTITVITHTADGQRSSADQQLELGPEPKLVPISLEPALADPGPEPGPEPMPSPEPGPQQPTVTFDSFRQEIDTMLDQHGIKRQRMAGTLKFLANLAEQAQHQRDRRRFLGVVRQLLRPFNYQIEPWARRHLRQQLLELTHSLRSP
ncbi:MAG: hypothetical protein COU69_03760 [Candidatus Pacebacteria bacterium CG10_big_fil_rev_8_21_14_0_10_56_10]|nr:MAG: hypothetical protein COU69_03760 [Candidatus Pacebacteria bacterium CG10_big_fil_rev_8_21_14_0_10_56_10]